MSVDMRQALKNALMLKAYHALRVGPVDGPLKDEPAILLVNAHAAVDEAIAWLVANTTPRDELADKLEAWASEEGYLAQHAPGIEANIHLERERLLSDASKVIRLNVDAPTGTV